MCSMANVAKNVEAAQALPLGSPPSDPSGSPGWGESDSQTGAEGHQ